MGLRHTRAIAAPAAVVFDCLARLDQVPQWMTGIERIEDTSPPGMAGPVGARFRMWFRGRSQPGRFDGEVLDSTAPTDTAPGRFVIRFGNDRFTARVVYTVASTAAGSELGYAADFETAGFMVRTMSAVFSPMAYRMLVRQIDSLQALAETRAGDAAR